MTKETHKMLRKTEQWLAKEESARAGIRRLVKRHFKNTSTAEESEKHGSSS